MSCVGLGSGPINLIHSAREDLAVEQEERRWKYQYFQAFLTVPSCLSGSPDERSDGPFASGTPEGQPAKSTAPFGFRSKGLPDRSQCSKRSQDLPLRQGVLRFLCTATTPGSAWQHESIVRPAACGRAKMPWFASIQTLPSKQNCMRLMSPDPNQASLTPGA